MFDIIDSIQEYFDLERQWYSDFRYTLFIVYLYKVSTFSILIIGTPLIALILLGWPLDLVLVGEHPDLVQTIWPYRFALIALIGAIMLTTFNRWTRYRLTNIIFGISLTLINFLTAFLMGSVTSEYSILLYFSFLFPMLTIIAPADLTTRLRLVFIPPLAWFAGLYLQVGFDWFLYLYSLTFYLIACILSFAIGQFVFYHMIHITFFQRRELAIQKQKIDDIAKHDQLTGLYRRQTVEDEIKNEIERARRYDHPFSVIMFDLDHFKDINDTYGHQVGDKVLTKFSTILEERVQKQVRRSDIAGRYGGEEFIIALPHTDVDGAVIVGNRIRKSIKEVVFEADGESFSITTSAGCSQLREDDSFDDLVKRADMALYYAKQDRNTIAHYGDIDNPEALEGEKNDE